MFNNIKTRICQLISTMAVVIMVKSTKVFAAITPDPDLVDDIASKGLKIFFGALAGFAVVAGGIELYGAFMAHRENIEQGGFGGAQNKVQQKIFAGIMCLIAAGIIFIVMRWTQSLFDLA